MKSDRARQTPYSFKYIWNPQNKTNEQMWKYKNWCIDAEYKLVFARGEDCVGMTELAEGD